LYKQFSQNSVPQILQIYIIYTLVQQFSNQNLPQLHLKLKTCSVDMLLTTHHSCMQNRPCKEDYHQFIVYRKPLGKRKTRLCKWYLRYKWTSEGDSHLRDIQHPYKTQHVYKEYENPPQGWKWDSRYKIFTSSCTAAQ